MKKAQQNEMWEEVNHKAVKQERKKMVVQSIWPSFASSADGLADTHLLIQFANHTRALPFLLFTPLTVAMHL